MEPPIYPGAICTMVQIKGFIRIEQKPSTKQQ